ncbi:MAG: ABC transporter substrate-binding protein [Anaerolineae bacterium]|nr:ABC transporter substrate-binding protein [Anaerolineae bacterium]
MPSSAISRRDFLRASGLTAGLALATACAGATPAPAEPTAAPVEPTAAPAEATPAPAVTEAPVSKYSEAPSLAAKVAAGDLPPVEERLPAEPLIVECIEEPGEYGGDIRRAGLASAGHMTMYLWEGFTRWDYRTGRLQITPNIAKGWDVSEDGTTYTFYLRKGMKWSDGHPFTADDVMFWYEDIALNEELMPSFPGWLTVAGEKVKIEKVDDYTVTFSWSNPYALLLESMCFNGQSNPPFAPRHYLEQFHINYADPDELDSLVKAKNFEAWYQLFQNMNDATINPELPSVWPWVPSVEWGAGKTVPALRNPYYFKVDVNGKQLPYVDRLVTESCANTEVILMKGIAGEVDLQCSQFMFADYSLLKENEETGDYRILDWEYNVSPCVYVSQTARDLGQRQVFQTTEFRHALSHALNRDEMNDLFWHGLAKPENTVPSPSDPFYKEGWGQTAIEFDLDRANALLDEAGLDQRDGDGFRLRPDGQRLQLYMENYPTFELGANAIDIFTQVAEYWRELGIEAQAREVERTLWTQRALGNESDMPAYCAATFLWALDPGWFVPYGNCYWAQAYAEWQRTGGKGGEEPPQEYKQLIEWYDALKAEPDPAKRLELGQRIGDQHNEKVYMVGLCTPNIDPMVAKKGLVNVLERGISDWRVHRDMLTWPFQVWWRRS